MSNNYIREYTHKIGLTVTFPYRELRYSFIVEVEK